MPERKDRKGEAKEIHVLLVLDPCWLPNLELLVVILHDCISIFVVVAVSLVCH